MNKYLRPRNYIHFISRKTRLFFRRLVCFGMNVQISSSANVAFSSSISATDGVLEIGPYCLVDRGVVIRTYGGQIVFGSHTTIGPFSCVYGGGSLQIGSGVRIGPSCSIIAANHNFSDISTPIYLQGMTCKGIQIADDVWIGAGAVILDGVSIGKGAVVAAGAVVSRSVPAGAVVAGVPAKLLRQRK
jgi:acetyltransferase-like isoleucine patch superfamily enzyme